MVHIERVTIKLPAILLDRYTVSREQVVILKCCYLREIRTNTIITICRFIFPKVVCVSAIDLTS